MNAHKEAEALCMKAEKLGLCHPTESMIAQRFDEILSNQWQEIEYELRREGHREAAEYLERLSVIRNEPNEL